MSDMNREDTDRSAHIDTRFPTRLLMVLCRCMPVLVDPLHAPPSMRRGYTQLLKRPAAKRDSNEKRAPETPKRAKRDRAKLADSSRKSLWLTGYEIGASALRKRIHSNAYHVEESRLAELNVSTEECNRRAREAGQQAVTKMMPRR